MGKGILKIYRVNKEAKNGAETLDALAIIKIIQGDR